MCPALPTPTQVHDIWKLWTFNSFPRSLGRSGCLFFIWSSCPSRVKTCRSLLIEFNSSSLLTHLLKGKILSAPSSNIRACALTTLCAGSKSPAMVNPVMLRRSFPSRSSSSWAGSFLGVSQGCSMIEVLNICSYQSVYMFLRQLDLKRTALEACCRISICSHEGAKLRCKPLSYAHAYKIQSEASSARHLS